MHQHLLNNILKQEQLSDEDITLCYKLFSPVQVPKNTILDEANHTPKHLYYIVSGFMRLFYYDESGNEITTHINCPNGFFCSYMDFLNKQHSAVNVQCVTDCDILKICRADYSTMIEKSTAWKNYVIFVLQESLNYNENRAKNLATLSAEQRYLELVNSQPEILDMVPLQYIASFLGIKPESLSRIRKNLLNKC